MEIRSKLFVPGTRPELFPKAATGKADSISFDLEDAVPFAQKDQAREAVGAYLRADGSGNGKVNIVRVNAVTSEMFQFDVERVVSAGVHVINLPKVQSWDEVLTAVRGLEYWEHKAGVKEAIGILATIESPKGLRMAHEIAGAHPRVVGLQIGVVDLNLACGFQSGNLAVLNHVRVAARLAASEAGIALLDGAFVRVSDPEAFRREAEEARALGANGKSCIHPSQVLIANEVFSPGAEEVERATRLLAAVDAAGSNRGAFVYEGDMVDLPVVERARGVLARAGQRGAAAPSGSN